MPANRRSATLGDPELYEELRKDGASKQKAARVSKGDLVSTIRHS